MSSLAHLVYRERTERPLRRRKKKVPSKRREATVRKPVAFHELDPAAKQAQERARVVAGDRD